MDAYDSALVMRLIETHLEMSAALRRDIFDAETVRVFAGKVQTHESLRMLTLFTYSDIQPCIRMRLRRGRRKTSGGCR